jgi:hypothetical protein
MGVEEYDKGRSPEALGELGCLGLLLLFGALAIVHMIVSELVKPTSVEEIEACSAACGPARMGEWNERERTCRCEGDHE